MSNIDKIRSRVKKYYDNEKKERERKSNRYQAKWQKYYQSNDWKSLREYKIIQSPLCENCEKFGLYIPAEEIHHLIPFGTGKSEQDKWKLLLDYNNLISLCKECHLEFHTKLKNNQNITTVTPPKLAYEKYI